MAHMQKFPGAHATRITMTNGKSSNKKIVHVPRMKESMSLLLIGLLGHRLGNNIPKNSEGAKN